MPLYDFECNSTNQCFERMVPLADFDHLQLCACQSPATRIISAPRFIVEQVDYHCPITNKHIGSKKAHEYNLASHNCRVFEPGETKSAEKHRHEHDLGLDRKLDEAVERQWESMTSDKKEKLANELTSGTDLAVERRTV